MMEVEVEQEGKDSILGVAFSRIATPSEPADSDSTAIRETPLINPSPGVLARSSSGRSPVSVVRHGDGFGVMIASEDSESGRLSKSRSLTNLRGNDITGPSDPLKSPISPTLFDSRRRLPNSPTIPSFSSTITSESANDRRLSISSHTDQAAVTGVPGSLYPNLISALTQTMIGEGMYKYTRRAVGGGISEYRHKRFFWVHPFTKTLYWSASEPGVMVGNPVPRASLSYLLARPGGETFSNMNGSAEDQKRREKRSFQRLQYLFGSKREPSTISRVDVAASYKASNGDGLDVDSEDEELENMRLCCDEKVDLTKLERDHHHPSQHHLFHY
ncbi:meiotic cell cortex C-terminal pleckstrin homology-domain-containing protein [Jimgerdemannia flammicorona]|uniref:Meiotic cell cortex C-terminal pleckstrin homology-domain-containing protein n=1 Tax=Jimgerdemannia flammicorona TaxID=994334 RepID=A0A433CXB3_9FUNG|nr:meiotic cell cortex C-terminal pleckstrin homology-domain-containing protein [Jimgerdemannia flammicorona]